LGYFLINPLRRLVENPGTLLGPLVEPGMTILEPGCGMGYFTLPLARMVGENGCVIVVDVQPKMLESLSHRARKAGLEDRIAMRAAAKDRLDIADLAGKIDLAVAIHMVHELRDPARFFEEVRAALKPGGKMFIMEPKGHVSANAFSNTALAAEAAGFSPLEKNTDIKKRRLFLEIAA
jgi:cyclopropane fatty-acyl-phospholipid synthase-like methyltransferase